MYLYAWMKFVETAPERYDKSMEVMTGGLLSKIKNDIARQIPKGSNVLDIGCGTATLAIQLAKEGVIVTGLDCSLQMLEIAKQNIMRSHCKDITLVNESVTQLGLVFKENTFDYIVSTVALGEFPKEYLTFIFQECLKILKPGGHIIVADEVWPRKTWRRFLHAIVMAAAWIPQFLILRRVFYPIKDLESIIEGAGYLISEIKTYGINDSFLLVDAVPIGLQAPVKKFRC